MPEITTQPGTAQPRARLSMLVVCLCFFAVGTAMSAIGPALPELAARTGSGLGDLGGIFSALFLGGLVAQMVAGPLSDRLDQRVVLVAGAILFSLGTLGYATSRALPLTLAGALVSGLGQGALVVACNIVIVRVFPGSTAALNLASIFFGLGDVAGPALAVPSLSFLGGVTPVLWAGAALVLVPAALAALLPPATHRQPAVAAAARPAPIYRIPLLWGLGALLLLYVGVEMSMAGWTATYVLQTTTLGAGTAALLTSGFWLAATAGRLLGVLLSTRLTPNGLLQLCLSGALAGGVLLALGIGSAPLTIAAVLLIGLCFGPVYPTVIGLAANGFGQAQGSAVSVVASMGSVGGMLLPWLNGILLTRGGPVASTLLVVAGTLAMLALHSARRAYSHAARYAFDTP